MAGPFPLSAWTAADRAPVPLGDGRLPLFRLAPANGVSTTHRQPGA